jgi:hypothetical protein
MLHLSGIYTMVVVLRLIEVNTLPHCTEVKKGVGEEIIHFLVTIMKTCTGLDKFKLAQFCDDRPSF